MDVENKLENMLRELLDFIDTPYFNSMFSDLCQYNFDELRTRITIVTERSMERRRSTI